VKAQEKSRMQIFLCTCAFLAIGFLLDKFPQRNVQNSRSYLPETAKHRPL